MIKTNQLRIGNLYIPTDGSPGFAIITADDIKAFSLGAIYGKPIPLTPEMLEQLGFQKKYDFLYKEVYGEVVMALFPVGKGFRLLDNSGNGKVGTTLIDYLHELQNLYITLTGEELNINF